MDKFLADASHKRACIFMTCSRPVTLTFSVMQYFLPRRVTYPSLISQSSLRTVVLRGISKARATWLAVAGLPATWAMNTGSAT